MDFFPLPVCIWYVCAYSWVWIWVCTCHSVCVLEENCKYWCSPSTLFETGPLVIHYPCQASGAESIWEISCSTTGTLWVIAICFHGQLCLGIESWTQVLMTAKQMLYQLNHLTKPYVSSLKVNFSFLIMCMSENLNLCAWKWRAYRLQKALNPLELSFGGLWTAYSGC